MRIGVPLSSVNCFEGWDFFSFASLATETGAIRVPNPAAGMITNTFIAGCQYTSAKVRSSNSVVNSGAVAPAVGDVDSKAPDRTVISHRGRLHAWLALDRSIGNRCRRGGNGYRHRRGRRDGSCNPRVAGTLVPFTKDHLSSGCLQH